jgi:hypothetical protein
MALSPRAALEKAPTARLYGQGAGRLCPTVRDPGQERWLVLEGSGDAKRRQGADGVAGDRGRRCLRLDRAAGAVLGPLVIVHFCDAKGCRSFFHETTTEQLPAGWARVVLFEAQLAPPTEAAMHLAMTGGRLIGLNESALVEAFREGLAAPPVPVMRLLCSKHPWPEWRSRLAHPTSVTENLETLDPSASGSPVTEQEIDDLWRHRG